MAGWALAGAMLVLASCAATPETTRPVRAALLCIGLTLVLSAVAVALVTTTLE